LRLRLEEPVQRRQGASEAPAVPTAPISMSLSFARLPEVGSAMVGSRHV
jgi:hypothetical protein